MIAVKTLLQSALFRNSQQFYLNLATIVQQIQDLYESDCNLEVIRVERTNFEDTMVGQKSSATVAKALLDLANLKSIDPAFDLGEDVSIVALEQLLQATQEDIAEFNVASATMETKRQMIREKEQSIVELVQRLKLGVGSRYGHKSSQYEKVRKVGKRSSKKRPEEEPAVGEAARA